MMTSTRLYLLLLHLYPASFRAEYGSEMCAIFARQRGQAFAPVFWLRTILETVFNAAAVHAAVLGQDLRHTVRSWRRSPGFVLTAVSVAALGIGATTAAYTMLDYVLVRPFPYTHQDRLVQLLEDLPTQGMHRVELSPANYRDWKQMSTSFEQMAAYHSLSANLVDRDNPQHIDGASVTAEMFPMVGAQPLLGRFFTPEEDRNGAPGALVLSYGLWQELFAGDSGVLGRKISLDGAPYSVIGVMPPGFYFPNREARLWTAMRFSPGDFLDRGNLYLYGMGLLKPGVSIGQARAEMQGVTQELIRLYPKQLRSTGATLTPLRETVSPQTTLMLNALMGAAVCVLLIACANLANLLLVRGLARRRELAVRAALGAGRERLARQMLTESLALAGLGGGVGVLLGAAVLPLLARLVPVSLPLAEAPSMDLRALFFAIAVTFASGILFGAAPAWRGRGVDANALRDNARAGGSPHERLRSALVIVEIAACVTLLASTGLLLRALWRIRAVDPGFRVENVLTLRTVLPMPKYEKVATRDRFYRRVLSEARRLPGVTDAAYTSFLPMVMRGGLWPVDIPEHPRDPFERQSASLRYVTPGYFSAMGIPMLKGRDVADSDAQPEAFQGSKAGTVQEQDIPLSDIPRVAVVSQSLADRYWPGQDPIGHHLNIAFFDRVVVGVAGAVRVRGLEQSSEPQVYLPYQQVPDRWMTWYPPKDLVVRASGNAAGLASVLRRIVHDADPEQPVSDVRLLSEIVGAETETRSIQARAVGAFAVIALMLAAIGIHGLLSFAVSQRTQEIGVRIALGATRSGIVGMIMRRGLMLAAIGVILGAGAAFFAGHAMQAILAAATPDDPTALMAALAVAVLMVLAGSLGPALRATRVDPIQAIRAERF
jgi:putative ABC transport system permease protein